MNEVSAVDASTDARRVGDVAANVPVKLTHDELRRLSQVNPLLGGLHVIGEWSLIIATIYLCQRFWNPLLYIFAVAFIGARQHALLILMHDGVHYRLFRNRKLNDWVSEILLAWPHLVSARSYRKNHLAHHKYLNSPQDPDLKRHEGDPAWLFPQTVSNLAKTLFRDVSGLNGIVLLKLAASLVSDEPVSTSFLVARYGFYVAALGAIVYAGVFKGLLIYWLVPFFTWLVFIMRIRSIAEHYAIESSGAAYPAIRTTRAAWLERVFLAPKNVNYHIEHHFFPSVPFYRLPKLHAILMSKPGYREGAHVTSGYWAVLGESVGRTTPPRESAGGFAVAEMEPIQSVIQAAG